jgi:hypothetical protein
MAQDYLLGKTPLREPAKAGAETGRRRFMPFVLPVATLLLLSVALFLQPKIGGITGFAVLGSPDLSAVKISLSTKQGETLPEDAVVSIKLGQQEKSMTAAEFVRLSGQDYEESPMLGSAERFGFVGDHDYAVSLDRLGFSPAGLGGSPLLEVTVGYKDAVLYHEQRPLSLS